MIQISGISELIWLNTSIKPEIFPTSPIYVRFEEVGEYGFEHWLKYFI